MAADSPGSREAVEFRFRSMSQADAGAIAACRYPDDWTSDDLADRLDRRSRADEYVAVDSDAGGLIRFFLDPGWTGHGLGRDFVEAGLKYARRRFVPERFTLSVASFNRRAITVYELAGLSPSVNGRNWVHRDGATRVRPLLEGHP